MTPWTFRTYNDWMKIGQQLAPILDGKLYQATVQPFKRRRTNDQNALMHVLIRDLALFTGHTEARMKEIVKKRYAPIVAEQIADQFEDMPMDTSAMNTEVASAFIERLYQLGAEIGCVFSEPKT